MCSPDKTVHLEAWADTVEEAREEVEIKVNAFKLTNPLHELIGLSKMYSESSNEWWYCATLTKQEEE